MLTLPAVYIVAQIIIYITRVSIYHFSNSGQETRLTASQFYSLSTWSSQTKLAVAKCYTVWSICFSRILQRTRSTDDQFTNHAVLGITAATCCIVCVMVLVILSVCAKCYSRSTVCGTVIKRLAVGLSVATCCLSLLLHFILYVIFTQKKKVKHLCEFEGFLANHFASVQVLLALDVCLVLFLEMLKASWKLKLECYEKVKGAIVHVVSGRSIN